MSIEIHNPAGVANTSSYGGQTLTFDDKGIARVDSLGVPLERWLRAAGYKIVDLDKTPEAASVFNPDEHNVDAVLKYLAEADETERARVLALEEAGQARKGILGTKEDGHVE